MTDDELKLNRRRFLRHSAIATAATGGLASITLRTDVAAQAPHVPEKDSSGLTDPPYPYHKGP